MIGDPLAHHRRLLSRHQDQAQAMCVTWGSDPDGLNDDPAEAAYRIHWSVGYPLRDRDASLVNTVLGRCRDRAVRDAAARKH